VGRFVRWLDASPHPFLACEITHQYVAAARWTRGGAALDGFAVQKLPPGCVIPSAVETNITQSSTVQLAIKEVFSRLKAQEQDVALLVPDPVIRVFVQHFDEFPRNPAEAVPMLRWKLKKSVPFEAEETLVSYMPQQPREDGVDIVTGLARMRIVKEYEQLAETAGMRPGVVLSSSLAAVSLVDDRQATLMARLAGTTLTTAIVRQGALGGYRCTDLPSDVSMLSPSVLLEEIYPIAAYYQDTWHESIYAVRLGGLGGRLQEFIHPIENEFHCSVGSLVGAAVADRRIPPDAQPLVQNDLEGLLGWMMSR
jgi:type IV pilus assembly protein PilM